MKFDRFNSAIINKRSHFQISLKSRWHEEQSIRPQQRNVWHWIMLCGNQANATENNGKFKKMKLSPNKSYSFLTLHKMLIIKILQLLYIFYGYKMLMSLRYL